MKSLFKSVAILTFFSIATRALGFVLKIIFSHTLTAEAIGVYSIISSIFMVLSTMVAAGLPLVVSRIVAASNTPDTRSRGYRAVTCGTVIGLGLSIFVSMLVIFLQPLITKIFDIENAYDMLLLTLPGVIFTGVYAGVRGYFWGKEEYTTLSVVELVEQLVRIVSCLVLFFLVGSISAKYVPVVTLSISIIVSTILGFILYLRQSGKFPHAHAREYGKIVATYAPITALRITSSLLQPTINLILPYRLTVSGFSSSQALALLGIMSGMTLPLLSIPSAIIGSLAMALIPRISNMYDKRDNFGLERQIQSSVDFTLFCSFLILPIFLSMGVPICKFLFASETAGHYLELSAILLIPQGISMLSTSLLNSLNCEKSNFVHSLIGSAALIACIYILPQWCDIQSLIYGMGINYLIVSILNYRKIRRLVGIKIKFARTITLSSIVTLGIVIFSKLTFPLLVTIFGNLVSIITLSIIDVIIFVILMNVCKIVDITYFRNRVKASIKARTQSKTKSSASID